MALDKLIAKASPAPPLGSDGGYRPEGFASPIDTGRWKLDTVAADNKALLSKAGYCLSLAKDMKALLDDQVEGQFGTPSYFDLREPRMFFADPYQNFDGVSSPFRHM